MPRQGRFVLPGQLHHVTQRGNYRQDVFFEDQDKAVYLKYADQYAREFNVSIYAFCLMSNHVHFLVKPLQADSLACMFRITHQKYSLYLNKRLNQFGHRWQSRFYSCVVMGSHVHQAIRYVELNPVRARLVQRPWDFFWSSAQAHMGKAYRIIQLADIADYIQVDSWRDYLMQEQDQADVDYIRRSTQQGRIFGPKELVLKLELQMKKKLQPQLPGRPKKKKGDGHRFSI